MDVGSLAGIAEGSSARVHVMIATGAWCDCRRHRGGGPTLQCRRLVRSCERRCGVSALRSVSRRPRPPAAEAGATRTRIFTCYLRIMRYDD